MEIEADYGSIAVGKVANVLITKPMPGFGELFRMLSYQQVQGAAMLSRAVGGLAGMRG